MHSPFSFDVQLAVMGLMAGFYVGFGFSFCAAAIGLVSGQTITSQHVSLLQVLLSCVIIKCTIALVPRKHCDL